MLKQYRRALGGEEYELFRKEKWERMRRASEEQLLFAKAYVLGGKNKSDAYRAAYPGAEKATSAQVAYRADKAFHTKGVQDEIKRLQAESADVFHELVTRESLLCDVAELIEKAKKSAYIMVPDPEDPEKMTEVLNDKAANVLLRALERASKMIGADEPEQVQSKVVIGFEGDFDRYAD